MGRDVDLVFFDDKKYLAEVAPLLLDLFHHKKVPVKIIEALKSINYWSDFQPSINRLSMHEIYPWIDNVLCSSKIDELNIDIIIDSIRNLHNPKFLKSGYLESAVDQQFNAKFKYDFDYNSKSNSFITLMEITQEVIPLLCWAQNVVVDGYVFDYAVPNSVFYRRRDSNIASNYIEYALEENIQIDKQVVSLLLKLCYRWVGVASYDFLSDNGGALGWLSYEEVLILIKGLAILKFKTVASIEDIWINSELSLFALYNMAILSSKEEKGLAFYVSG